MVQSKDIFDSIIIEFSKDFSDKQDKKIIDKAEMIFILCESTLRISALLLQRIDWLISGDDGVDAFFDRTKDEMDKLAGLLCPELKKRI